MKKRFNDKKLAIIIMVILIATALFPIINAQRTDQFKKNKKDQSNTGDPDTATVYIKKYDAKNRQYINEPICSLKKREAEQLRDELYQAEKKYNTNMEKLDKQLSILHNWGIVPPHITIQDFLVIKEKIWIIS